MRISCLICQNAFSFCSVVMSLNCGHLFHQTCLRKWNRVQQTCPSCRMKVENKFQIYFKEDNELLPTDDLETKYHKMLSRLNEVLQEKKNISLEKIELSMLLTALAEGAEVDYKEKKELNKELWQCIEDRDKYKEMAEEMVEMKKLMKEFKRFKPTLQSTNEKISKTVKCTPVNKQAVKYLVQKIEQLKEQGDRHAEKRKQLISNQNRMRREMKKLRASSRQLEAELVKLKQAAIKNRK